MADVGENVSMVDAATAKEDASKKIEADKLAIDKQNAEDADKGRKVDAVTKSVNALDAAAAKKVEAISALSAFKVDQVKVTLIGGVTAADYVSLFKKVATDGTDQQISAANNYMKALKAGDLTVNDANTDKQPGILTFQKVCSTVGQKDMYTTVKETIDKEVAAKNKANEITTTALTVNDVNYVFTEDPSKQTLLLASRSEKSGVKILFTFDAAGYIKSFRVA